MSNITGFLKKYKAYVSNIEWHIKTNKPTEEEIKKLNTQIDSYNEVIADLEYLSLQQNKVSEDEIEEENNILSMPKGIASEWFAEQRERSGLTLRKVEDETGISNAYLSQLENGKVSNPSYKIVETLKNFYGKTNQNKVSDPATEQSTANWQKVGDKDKFLDEVRGKDVIGIFAENMKIELNANKHKGDWKEWNNIEEMISELEWHKAKLLFALRENNKNSVREYLADCGNILMFIGNAGHIFDNNEKYINRYRNGEIIYNGSREFNRRETAENYGNTYAKSIYVDTVIVGKESGVSAGGNKNLSGYSMDDKIGSHHWFNTLMAGILHIGEYMKLHDTIDSELQKDWGNKLNNTAKDMIEWFKEYASIVNKKDNVVVNEAIEFAEWLFGEGYTQYDGKERWINFQNDNHVYSTKELYKIFSESQPKK
jgi:transcriptional regulator with XRE-family HTH domain